MESTLKKIESFVNGKIEEFDAHPFRVGLQLIVAFVVIKWIWKKVS